MLRCYRNPVQRVLVDRGLPPEEHLVDADYVSAVLLVGSWEEHGIRLVGPPREDTSWQSRTEGAYTVSSSPSTGIGGRSAAQKAG